jgi:RNA recognition motif-containing protein
LKPDVRERLFGCFRKKAYEIIRWQSIILDHRTRLRDLFAPYGVVTDVQVVTDRMSGSSRGFAFVTMGNRNEGQAAITALEGLSHDGRNLTVSEARPKTEHRQNNSFSRRR